MKLVLGVVLLKYEYTSQIASQRVMFCVIIKILIINYIKKIVRYVMISST